MLNCNVLFYNNLLHALLRLVTQIGNENNSFSPNGNRIHKYLRLQADSVSLWHDVIISLIF